MQTIIDEYRKYRKLEIFMRFYLKRYIERYFVRAIVLFLATVTNKAVSFFPHKTQFGASDVSTKVELYDFFPQQNDYSKISEHLQFMKLAVNKFYRKRNETEEPKQNL